MTDELLPWNELPVRVRRSRRLLYEYQRTGEIPGPTPDPEPTKVTYGFTSYSDAEKTEEWGTGTVETTGETSGDYTEVEVLTNSTDESFVGRKFFIVSNAKTDGTVYELFTDAGTTSAGIFVTITTV